MESSQLEGDGQFRIRHMHHVLYKPRDSIGKGIEQNQHPDHTKHVEGQVSQGRPSRLCITRQSGQIGRNGRTDIFTQHQGNTQMVIDPTIRTHNQGNGHCCGRSLHNHGQYGTNEQEENDGKETHVRIILDKRQHIGIGSQVGRIGF